MDVLDSLAKCTVKIEGDNGSFGTGFFFDFNEKDDKVIPALVTNRHVLEGLKSIKLIFSKNDYFITENKIVEKFEFKYENIQSKIIYHSNPDIDLCALLLGPLRNFQSENNLYLDYNTLSMENIPEEEELEKLRFVEDVLMVGYPLGLSDTKNNMPIFRRGTTATHPGVDFEGNPECIVDMTITPGSSGSPVFIYNSNGFKLRDGSFQTGRDRLMFLGINKAVFIENKEGDVIEVPSPTKFIAKNKIGVNLGLIVKSKALIDIENQINERNYHV